MGLHARATLNDTSQGNIQIELLKGESSTRNYMARNASCCDAIDWSILIACRLGGYVQNNTALEEETMPGGALPSNRRVSARCLPPRLRGWGGGGGGVGVLP